MEESPVIKILQALRSIQAEYVSIPGRIRKEPEAVQNKTGQSSPSCSIQEWTTLQEENRSLKARLTSMKQLQKDQELKLAELKKNQDLLETELCRIRDRNFIQPAAGAPRKKKRFPLFLRIFFPAKAGLTEAEKKARIHQLFFSWQAAFNDLQVQFLARVLKDGQLPAEDLAILMDPSMTSFRMQTLYSLLCAENRIAETVTLLEDAVRSQVLEETKPVHDSSSGQEASRPVLKIETDPLPTDDGKGDRLLLLAKSITGKERSRKA